MEREYVVSTHTTQKWFKKFNEGHTDHRNEPRSSRLITVNTEAIRDAIKPINQPLLKDYR